MEVEHDLGGAWVAQVPRSDVSAVLRMDLPGDWRLSDDCWLRDIALLLLFFYYDWLLSHALRQGELLASLYRGSKRIGLLIDWVGLSSRLNR